MTILSVSKFIMSSTGIKELVDWAENNGAYISPNIGFKEVSINNIGAYFKASATDSNKLSESSHLKLPINLIITLKNAIESFNDGGFDNFEKISQETTNTNSLLKLYLSRERSQSYIEKSFYGHYINLLPKLYEMDTPYVWTGKDKAFLKGTNLGNSLRDNISQLVEEWWQLINLLPNELPKPEQHFVNMKFYYEYKFHTDDDLFKYFVEDEDKNNWTSFSNYLWASIILKSRSFPAYLLKGYDSRTDIKEDETMLLPLIDLINHNPSAKVNWSVDKKQDEPVAYFNFKSDSDVGGDQLYNNYGLKGNEELLLAYGFVIDGNEVDTSALKIKLPLELLPGLEKNGVKLPKITDYTFSILNSDQNKVEENKSSDYGQYKEGIIFYISSTTIPENLTLLFQWLVKNTWESTLTLRMKLAGINQLRQALETKKSAISSIKLPNNINESKHFEAIRIYIQSQKKIFSAGIKMLKREENDLLGNVSNKSQLITLKNVFKKDVKFQQSLLVTLGVVSYDTIVDNNLQDQVWLLYLIRCYNRDEYIISGVDQDDEGDEENYLPKWIQIAFIKLMKETEVGAAEVMTYKELYQGLIIPLNEAVPEIYNKGKWGVKELIIGAKLLDMISFVRGKEQECIVVKPVANELN